MNSLSVSIGEEADFLFKENQLGASRFSVQRKSAWSEQSRFSVQRESACQVLKFPM
jgi:hypothetical protein